MTKCAKRLRCARCRTGPTSTLSTGAGKHRASTFDAFKLARLRKRQPMVQGSVTQLVDAFVSLSRFRHPLPALATRRFLGLADDVLQDVKRGGDRVRDPLDLRIGLFGATTPSG